MIGYISGVILENQEGRLLVGVPQGGTSKIGYSVLTPQSAQYGGLHAGQTIELFIHTHVREDALDLLGFLSRMEKEIFLTLLTVNGIGPKGALGILSKLEIATLVEAVLSENVSLLTEVPGIGKKTAERLVMELKDPLRKKVDSGVVLVPQGALGTSAQPRGAVGTGDVRIHVQILKEAREALGSLGYREVEITAALKRVSDQWKDSAREEARAQDVIKLALKELS